MNLVALGMVVLAALPSARRPTVGGTLRLAIVEPLDSFMPSEALTAAEWQAVALVHAGLYRVGRGGKAEPDLALALPEATTPKRFRVRLRTARFHDGSRLGGQDVTQAMAILGGGPLRRVMAGLRFSATGGEVLIEADAPIAPAELALRLAGPAFAIAKGKGGLVGLGPFRLAAKRGDGTRLVRHEAFHRGAPYLEAIEIALVRDGTEAARRLHYDEADLIFEDAAGGKAVRVASEALEIIGIVGTRAEVERIAAVFPRAELARRMAGTTPIAAPLRTGTGAFVGVPEWLSAAVRPALATGAAWPIQPLDRTALMAALTGQTELEGVLVSWPPATDPQRVFSGDRRFAPLLTRTRAVWVRPNLHGAFFLPSGALDLSGAFLL